MLRPTRRDWIAGALGAVGAASRSLADAHTPPQVPARSAVNSVTGPVPADRLGLTLMHEHVLVDFIGADLVSPARYDTDLAFKKSCLTSNRPTRSVAGPSWSARRPTSAGM